MSKTPEDYRNIVKILKLQLLKVREENATLSHQMGIISDSETSCTYPHKLSLYPQAQSLSSVRRSFCPKGRPVFIICPSM